MNPSHDMFPSLPTIYIVATRCNSYRIVGKTHPLGWRASEAAEQKYDWGAGARGCEAADYPRKAATCVGQELGGLKPP